MALFTAFIRQRTDIHVSSLAEHITADNRAVQQFMDSFGGSANSALAALVDTVTTEAMPLAFQDAFSLCFLASIAGLLLLLIMKPAPYTPLTPVRVGTPVTA